MLLCMAIFGGVWIRHETGLLKCRHDVLATTNDHVSTGESKSNIKRHTQCITFLVGAPRLDLQYDR